MNDPHVAGKHVHDGEGPDVDPVTGDEAETFQPDDEPPDPPP